MMLVKTMKVLRELHLVLMDLKMYLADFVSGNHVSEYSLTCSFGVITCIDIHQIKMMLHKLRLKMNRQNN